MRPAPSSRVRSVLAVVAAVFLTGCTSGAPGDPEASAAERVGAIREARDVVVRPAQDLGTAAARLAARLDALVERPDADAVEAVRGAVDDLQRAREEVLALELDASTDDVRAAASALEDAADGAGQLATAVGEAADAVDEAVSAADVLEQVVAGWDEAGSRSQLLERFDELQAEAQALADDRDPPEACPGPVREAASAATFVVGATADLRELVAQRDGLAFDERRAELDVAPFGTTEDGDPRRLDGGVDPEACPAVERARAAAADVAAALRDLQDALNPADLRGDPSGQPSDGGSS